VAESGVTKMDEIKGKLAMTLQISVKGKNR
jgi:hypothetical protein